MGDVEFRALAESLTNVDELEDAALLLSSFLKCHRRSLNPKSPLLSKDSCQLLLTENPELHILLQKAHESKDFSEIDSNVPRIPRISWESYTELERITETLNEIRRLNKITPFIRGETPFSIWGTQRAEENAIATHIERLNIPTFNTRYPCTLIHQLGSFSTELSVQQRLENIFSFPQHTFLVNASGTGKTRLLLEGLCDNWGFYFTSVVDSSGLGSADINTTIGRHIPSTPGFKEIPAAREATNLDEAFNVNVRVAHRRFSEALLSRLLVFKLFLEYATLEGLTDVHKKHWLLLQLRPDVVGIRDVFESIQRHFMRSEVADDVVENAIMQTLQEISDVWDFTANGNLYVVLDEANRAANSFPLAFREENEYYPVLKQIIRTWRQHLEHLPVSFIVAGTDIPQKFFRTRSGEWDSFVWCSNTGAFDKEEDQRRYVRTFIPPAILSSAEGEALMDRLWRWLRGRHRFTAAFMTTLLQNDFQIPHNHLDKQIYTTTKYMPDDGAEYSTGRTSFTDYHEISLEMLKHSSAVRTMLHEALLHAISHFDGSRNLGPEGAVLVTQGQGHYLDESMSYPAADEPLVLIATAKWFMRDSRSITDLDYFNSAINLGECREIHRIDYVAIYLALAFDGTHLLSDVLAFTKVPAWAKKHARLIVWNALNRGDPTWYNKDSPHQFIVGVDSLAGVLEWMNVNEHQVPFCSYTSGSLSTLIFALELGRGSRVWVVLQAPSELEESVDVETVLQDLRSETIFKLEEASLGTSATESEDVIQTLKKLPNLQSNLGPHGVLGVVASLKRKIDLASPTISATNKQPVALLNIELMERINKGRSEQDLFDRLIFSFKRGGKRKDPPADEELPDEEEPPPAPPKKGRKKKGKEKAAAEATEAPSGSGPSGSDAQPSAERRYNLRTSTLNKRRATK